MTFLRDLARIVRPLSNVKSVAIVLFAYYLSGIRAPAATVVLAILALSCISSAIYAFNSLNDIAVDRLNKNKERYTIAVERFGPRLVKTIIMMLLAGGFGLGAVLGKPLFLAGLFGLAVVGYSYSSSRLRFKERRTVDVLFGGILPYSLRFAAGWLAFQTSLPPLLPLAGFAFAKAGGFLLYKELDRQYLLRLGIHNTITTNSRTRNMILSATFFVLAFFSFGGMIVNASYGIRWLGALPMSFLFFLPLILPALPIVYAQALGLTRWQHGPLRLLGLVHWMILVLLFAWAFLR